MDEKPKLRPVEVFPVPTKQGRLIGIRDATGLSDRIISASPGVVRILQMLDGEHNLLDIQAVLTRESGQLVYSDEIKKVLELLDEALLLEGERFDTWRARIEKEFADSPVRKATSAGTGYPEDAKKLRTFLDRILAEAEGKPSAAEVRGLIAPHIDHIRGRKTYAEAFAALAASPPADLFVILGTAHTESAERFVLTRKDFETPLGRAKTDTAFVDALAGRAGRDLFTDEFLHRGEHSIELELVFVQHLSRKAGREFGIVPILCGGFTEAMKEDRTPLDLPGVREVIEGLQELIAAEERRVCVIAGADLSHVGPRFDGGEPVTPGALRDLEAADRKTLSLVGKGDADGFYGNVALDENARNICGVAPVYVVLKVLRPAEVTLLRYDQWSADDGSSCVTFAACAVA